MAAGFLKAIRKKKQGRDTKTPCPEIPIFTEPELLWPQAALQAARHLACCLVGTPSSVPAVGEKGLRLPNEARPFQPLTDKPVPPSQSPGLLEPPVMNSGGPGRRRRKPSHTGGQGLQVWRPQELEFLGLTHLKGGVKGRSHKGLVE